MLGFNNAFNGLFKVLYKERNFKIQLIAFCLIITLGYICKITLTEWLIILIISALVLSLEIINTAIEKTCNLYSKEYNRYIKDIKDISAAAVLLTSLFAAVIGIIIFYPYVISCFYSN